MTETHVDREKEYHNHRFQKDPRVVLNRFYRVCGAMYESLDTTIVSYCRDVVVLEYGCGASIRAFTIANQCKHYSGIDISEVAIQKMRDQLKENQLESKVDFQVMNAEKMTFADNSFDVVFGSGILHHLDLQASISEIKRVLKPDGVTFFAEPFGHNPIINLFRRLTPKLRSPDEHPLLMKDLQHIRNTFSHTEVVHFSLLTPYIAVLPHSLHRYFLPIAEKMDNFLFKFSWISPLSWFVIVKMTR